MHMYRLARYFRGERQHSRLVAVIQRRGGIAARFGNGVHGVWTGNFEADSFRRLVVVVLAANPVVGSVGAATFKLICNNSCV